MEYNRVSKNNKRNKKNTYSKVSMSKLLEMLNNEVVVLQDELAKNVTHKNGDNQHYKKFDKKCVKQDKLASSNILGSAMAEGLLLDTMLASIFGGIGMTFMAGNFSNDRFSKCLSNLIMIIGIDYGQDKLQSSFILSVYPKGRVTVKGILKNISASDMRRSASARFISKKEASNKIKMLNMISEDFEKFQCNFDTRFHFLRM